MKVVAPPHQTGTRFLACLTPHITRPRAKHSCSLKKLARAAPVHVLVRQVARATRFFLLELRTQAFTSHLSNGSFVIRELNADLFSRV